MRTGARNRDQLHKAKIRTPRAPASDVAGRTPRRTRDPADSGLVVRSCHQVVSPSRVTNGVVSPTESCHRVTSAGPFGVLSPQGLQQRDSSSCLVNMSGHHVWASPASGHDDRLTPAPAPSGLLFKHTAPKTVQQRSSGLPGSPPSPTPRPARRPNGPGEPASPSARRHRVRPLRRTAAPSRTGTHRHPRNNLPPRRRPRSTRRAGPRGRQVEGVSNRRGAGPAPIAGPPAGRHPIHPHRYVARHATARTTPPKPERFFQSCFFRSTHARGRLFPHQAPRRARPRGALQDQAARRGRLFGSCLVIWTDLGRNRTPMRRIADTRYLRPRSSVYNVLQISPLW